MLQLISLSNFTQRWRILDALALRYPEVSLHLFFRPCKSRGIDKHEASAHLTAVRYFVVGLIRNSVFPLHRKVKFSMLTLMSANPKSATIARVPTSLTWFWGVMCILSYALHVHAFLA